MVDCVKTPMPQWLIDAALHTNEFRGPPYEKPPPLPPISSEAAHDLIDEIVAVCEKHGLWLGHEDDHGAFLVQRESTRNWLLGAHEDE